jgi:peptidoglycan/xylan/chitin deacetylase (PgdA/CDA1 family)
MALTLPGGARFSIDLGKSSAASMATQLRDALKAKPQDSLYEWLAAFYELADVELPCKPPPGMEPMSWANARAFVAMGHTIAPHTCSHRILSRLSDAESKSEISASAHRVAEQTSTQPAVFAYPTGRLQDFSVRDTGFLRDEGYRCAVSTEPRSVLSSDNIFALPRFSLPSTLTDFCQYLGFIEVAKARLCDYRKRSG